MKNTVLSVWHIQKSWLHSKIISILKFSVLCIGMCVYTRYLYIFICVSEWYSVSLAYGNFNLPSAIEKKRFTWTTVESIHKEKLILVTLWLQGSSLITNTTVFSNSANISTWTRDCFLSCVKIRLYLNVL